MSHPQVPAAFINAIAEEGTKAEAVEWLQKQWNETCQIRAILDADRETMRKVIAERDKYFDEVLRLRRREAELLRQVQVINPLAR